MRRETVALVGESGSGKSVTALAIMRLLQEPGRVTRGAIRFEGRDLAHLDERAMAKIRGDRIAMIFQEPMSSLNPLLSIGAHVAEPLRLHRGLVAGATRAPARSPCSTASAFPRRRAASTTIRIACPAACASA